MFGLLNDAAIAAHSAALPIPNGTYLPAYPCEYSRAPPATVGTPEYPLLCEYSRVSVCAPAAVKMIHGYRFVCTRRVEYKVCARVRACVYKRVCLRVYVPPAAKVTSLASNRRRCVTVRLIITPVASPTHVCGLRRVLKLPPLHPWSALATQEGYL